MKRKESNSKKSRNNSKSGIIIEEQNTNLTLRSSKKQMSADPTKFSMSGQADRMKNKLKESV